jgi:hypothetical protein
MPELLQGVFVLNLSLLLAFLVELHDRLLMNVHLVENVVLDCIFASLLEPVIVFPDFLLQLDHELLHLRQKVLHTLFVGDQRRLAALLQGLRLLFAVCHLRSNFNQPQIGNGVHRSDQLFESAGKLRPSKDKVLSQLLPLGFVSILAHDVLPA